MTPKTLRIWSRIHTWTSLVCTVFLVFLCLTGLPLIFHEEIDRLLGQRAKPDPLAKTSQASLPLDRLMDVARAARPGEAIRFATPVPGEPLWNMEMADTVQSRELTSIVTVDARTGRIMRTGDRVRSPVMQFIKDLHTDLLLDQPGMLFLGAVGLCFFLAIVSGVVLYAPFMRRLDFGTVRRNSRRAYWLDLHNLGGIMLTVWMSVVGLTGVVNTLSQQIANYWISTELSAMISPWRGLPLPKTVIPAQSAVDTALNVSPRSSVSTVAMPGTMFAGPHHYNVFLTGDQPLTSRLLEPVLINAETGRVDDLRSLPWYAQALFVSKPLHFGDYGGLFLKTVWASLDIATLIVLLSGLYLFFARRSTTVPSASRP